MATLKEVGKGIITHSKEHFHGQLYGYTLIFLIVTITLNYTFDFEDSILDRTFRTPWGFIAYPLYFAFPYYCIAIPQAYWKGETTLWQNSDFWKRSAAFILLLGFTKAFYGHYYFIEKLNDPVLQFYLKKIVRHLLRIGIYISVLWMLKQWWADKTPGIYGLHFGAFSYKPYLIMLLVMVPLIAWASFQPSFLKTYPMFKSWYYASVGGLPPLQSSILYEISYGFNFISVEVLFRGALVIGMANVLGKNAILPMVATYAFLHFGKPMAETIGSVFGGYILGIIALQSRTILGGVMIHMGVALLMDFAAYIQHFARGAF